MLSRWVLRSINWRGPLTLGFPWAMVVMPRPLSDDEVADLIRRWRKQQTRRHATHVLHNHYLRKL